MLAVEDDTSAGPAVRVDGVPGQQGHRPASGLNPHEHWRPYDAPVHQAGDARHLRQFLLRDGGPLRGGCETHRIVPRTRVRRSETGPRAYVDA